MIVAARCLTCGGSGPALGINPYICRLSLLPFLKVRYNGGERYGMNFRPQVGDTFERLGLFVHPFVYVGPSGPNGEDVVQNTPKRGVELVYFHEATQGRRLRLRYRAGSWYEGDEIAGRALSRLGAPYDLLGFNCEHLVTYAESGTPDSQQVRWGVGLAVGVLALCAVFSVGTKA